MNTAGLYSDGTVTVIGYNGNGQCDDVASWEGIVAVAEGYEFTLGLKSDGTVVSCGDVYHVKDTSGWSDIRVSDVTS